MYTLVVASSLAAFSPLRNRGAIRAADTVWHMSRSLPPFACTQLSLSPPLGSETAVDGAAQLSLETPTEEDLRLFRARFAYRDMSLVYVDGPAAYWALWNEFKKQGPTDMRR